ncbi:MAG: LysR family transcriptional regulator [Hyphomicrobiales bacterium]|nr:LysR family transcriptional regulator [Hyphomicrobiales bacterium]MBV8664411.1 LysR family transcriptional regulator [Hyphomicrobiales bacterium]
MELRHLRYFVAVADAGSLTLAAEQWLHTAQPSLSRQIRALENEVGAELFTRSVRGVELTAAGQAFLPHARAALAETEAAIEGARRAARPAKPVFALGFLTGQEMDWLPEAMHTLRDVLPDIEVTVTSDNSLPLAEALARGKLDLAFLRPEPDMPALEYRHVTRDPLVVVLPSDHHLAARKEIAIADLQGETFLGISGAAPRLQTVIEDYLKRTKVDLRPAYKLDSLAMAMSLVASARGIALLPAYAKNIFPWSVTSRALAGEPLMIDLVVGFNRANTSDTLKLFLSRLDALIVRGCAKAAPLTGACETSDARRG